MPATATRTAVALPCETGAAAAGAALSPMRAAAPTSATAPRARRARVRGSAAVLAAGCSVMLGPLPWMCEGTSPDAPASTQRPFVCGVTQKLSARVARTDPPYRLKYSSVALAGNPRNPRGGPSLDPA